MFVNILCFSAVVSSINLFHLRIQYPPKSNKAEISISIKCNQLPKFSIFWDQDGEAFHLIENAPLNPFEDADVNVKPISILRKSHCRVFWAAVPTAYPQSKLNLDHLCEKEERGIKAVFRSEYIEVDL